MIRRSAATLIEVLVAIFVTALGLMGLLALFPLGVVNMAHALQDSKCAQASANAFALAAAMNIWNDPSVIGAGDAFVDQIRDPQGNVVPPVSDGPSYPVYVDPYRAASAPYLPTGTTGGLPVLVQGGIPRRGVRFVSSLPTAFRWFALLDDVKFSAGGRGGSGPQSVIQREGRYSWAYMLRRPRFSDRSIVDLSVVVYSGRALVGDLGERPFGNVRFDPNSNVVSLFYTGVYWPAAFEVMHIEVWQAIFILLAVFFWVIWARWAQRRIEPSPQPSP